MCLQLGCIAEKLTARIHLVENPQIPTSTSTTRMNCQKIINPDALQGLAGNVGNMSATRQRRVDLSPIWTQHACIYVHVFMNLNTKILTPSAYGSTRVSSTHAHESECMQKVSFYSVHKSILQQHNPPHNEFLVAPRHSCSS
jgi:hypothetical protein